MRDCYVKYEYIILLNACHQMIVDKQEWLVL